MATNALLYSLQLSPSIVRVAKYQKAVVIDGNISAHFDAPIGANSGSRKPRIGFTPDIDGCAGLAGERVNPAIINLCERRPAHPIRVPFDTAVKSRGGFVGPIFLHRHYQLSLFPIGRHHGDQCLVVLSTIPRVNDKSALLAKSPKCGALPQLYLPREKICPMRPTQSCDIDRRPIGAPSRL